MVRYIKYDINIVKNHLNDDAGKISHKIAIEKAENEHEKFRVKQGRE